jgi:hypothetical protein
MVGRPVGAMVGTVKRCLRKVLGQSSLADEQLNTTLISIEAAVILRPFAYSGESDTLTPAHLQIGGSLDVKESFLYAQP